jgi:SepF-like predicted cell division protein (DUF552 family)
MKGLFNKIKSKLSGDSDFDIPDEVDKDFLHVDSEMPTNKAKVVLRPYILEDFDDVKPILDSLREGYTIPLINIKPLKDKDLIELKRAINKLKKTCDAIEGDIAGFGEDWIAVVPSFAQIYREKKVEMPEQRAERYERY